MPMTTHPTTLAAWFVLDQSGCCSTERLCSRARTCSICYVSQSGLLFVSRLLCVHMAVHEHGQVHHIYTQRGLNSQNPTLQTLNSLKPYFLQLEPWQEQCVGYGLVNFVSVEAAGRVFGCQAGLKSMRVVL